MALSAMRGLTESWAAPIKNIDAWAGLCVCAHWQLCHLHHNGLECHQAKKESTAERTISGYCAIIQAASRQCHHTKHILTACLLTDHALLGCCSPHIEA